MSIKGRVLGVAAGVAGVAAAGTAAAIARQRRRISGRGPGDDVPFGALRSTPITVVADDGLPLHAEVDEVADSPVSVVYVHGYALNLDCWHFQRASRRGRARQVFYDQRSHGRSARSRGEHCSIDQLGQDLMRVIDDLAHGPVVLVGHSMGGMAVLALAEQHPELFGERIVGVALIATTAGGLDPGRILFPLLPAGMGAGVMGRVVSTLSRGSAVIDRVRRLGHDVATVVTDTYAFGDDVPQSYLEFVYRMLDETPFSVVADFFPAFAHLDKWTHVEPLSRIPTAIICGTGDKITGVGHSRKLHATIHGSDLLELEGAGHLVILERHLEVDAELDDLLTRAIDLVGGSESGGRAAAGR